MSKIYQCQNFKKLQKTKQKQTNKQTNKRKKKKEKKMFWPKLDWD